MKCKQCGACCRSLIIEVEEHDAAREPKIKERGQRFQEGGYSLLDSTTHNCTFLTADNRCEIHAHKPVLCRTFKPGSPQCRYSRGKISFNKMVALQDAEEWT